MKLYTYSIIALLTFLGSASIKAQNNLGTKVIDVVKTYSPTISNVNKPREQTPTQDSLVLIKKEINYTIHSVPVASTFVPEKGKAAKVMKQKNALYNTSFAGFGIGNYGTIVADTYIHLPIDTENSFFLAGDHHSSQGGIKTALTKDYFSDSELELGYNHSSKNVKWGVSADAEHRLFNWYGIKPGVYSDSFVTNDIENANHTYIGGGVKGYISTNSFFKDLKLSARTMLDDYKSSEFEINANPTFTFGLSDYKIMLEVNADYLKGRFENDFLKSGKNLSYKWKNFAATPSFSFQTDNLSVNIGATLASISGNEFQKIKIYPKASVALKLLDEYAILHANLKGNTKLNSHQSLSTVNPYISPTSEILPTFNNYTASVGVKGNLDSDITYNAQLFYGGVEQLALFLPNIDIHSYQKISEKYQYQNSFNVHYDDGTFGGFKGEVEGNIAQEFFFTTGITYQSYKMKGFGKNTPNIPNFIANINTDYKITEDWFAGMDLLYTGERKSFDYQNEIYSTDSNVRTLKDYFNVSLHTDYTLNKQWNIFINANNLLSQSYDYWLYYPAQKLQVSAGVKYLFRM